jgi:hypothetical protein
MRNMFYAGGSIVVSDNVSAALLRYARALAKAGAADLVAVPSLTPEHRVGLSHILIGPASQLFSAPTGDIDVDLEDARLVEILESRTRNLDPDRPEWGSDIVDVSDFATFEWDF